MARNRRKKVEAETQVEVEADAPTAEQDEVVTRDEDKTFPVSTGSTQVASPPISNVIHTTKGNRIHMALTPDQIRSIYANRRTKGQYEQFLSQFLGSGEQGISVKEVWPTLVDKKASTLKQGFDNAKDRKEAPEGSENVDIIVDGENVFLMNTALLGDVLEGEAPGAAQTEEVEADAELANA